MKQIIKAHADIITVPEELKKMKQDYEKEGYQCDLLGNLLKIQLNDGYVMISWENGAFYQECYKTIDSDDRLIIL